MKMNKKGWVRIVEAVIAILLIIGGFMFFYIDTLKGVSKSEQIYNIERGILEEAERNNQVREWVLIDTNLDEIRNFIGLRLEAYSELEFEFNICNVDDACPLIPWPDTEEVYADEILISSTLDNYGPKKLKLFVWEL